MRDFVLRIGFAETGDWFYWTCLAESPADAIIRCRKYYKSVGVDIFAVFEKIFP